MSKEKKSLVEFKWSVAYRGFEFAWLRIKSCWLWEIHVPHAFPMSSPRPDRRGYGSIALGIVALTAITGAVYWYINRESSLGGVWNRSTHRTKRKSVVIVLNQACL